jgi:hypothetical protein
VNRRRFFHLSNVVVVASFVPVLFAQNQTPPNSGPSLELPMKDIENRLNAVDIRYRQSWQETGAFYASISYRVTGAHADPKTCALAYHPRTASEDGNQHETDVKLSIREIGTVTVEPSSELARREGVNFEFTPTVFDVVIKMVPGKTVSVHQRSSAPRGQTQEFDRSETVTNVLDDARFLDEDLANRLAKALIQVVALCGGGDKDPLK